MVDGIGLKVAGLKVHMVPVALELQETVPVPREEDTGFSVCARSLRMGLAGVSSAGDST